jgi:hypothetical protein
MQPESQDLPQKPTGRPSAYSEALAEVICERLIMGESMKAICADEVMPSESMVYRWLAKTDAFREQYTSAREAQAERMLDEIIAIADDTTNDDTQTDYGPIPNHEWITRSKVRIDSRKWFMGKVAPKKYGDSRQLDVTSGGQRITGIQINDVGGGAGE